MSGYIKSTPDQMENLIIYRLPGYNATHLELLD